MDPQKHIMLITYERLNIFSSMLDYQKGVAGPKYVRRTSNDNKICDTSKIIYFFLVSKNPIYTLLRTLSFRKNSSEILGACETDKNERGQKGKLS